MKNRIPRLLERGQEQIKNVELSAYKVNDINKLVKYFLKCFGNNYTSMPRPHCLLIKSVSHQVMMSLILLEIPKAGSVPRSIITATSPEATHTRLFNKTKIHEL